VRGATERSRLTVRTGNAASTLLPRAGVVSAVSQLAAGRQVLVGQGGVGAAEEH
jgi:hypothetical protein